MSKENKALVRRLLEAAFGQGKVEVVDEVLDSTSSAMTRTASPVRSGEQRP